jgi:hypothetical protein
VPIDLHLHSHISDGTDPPARLVELAHSTGLTAMALTDHDTLEGIPEAASAAEGRLELIAGIELSVQWGDRGMHLLGYWIPDGGAVDGLLAWVQEGRIVRNLEILEALDRMGISISVEELAEESGPGVTGRPHFAAILVRRGVVDTPSEAFDQYLGFGRPAYRPRRRLRAAQAIEAIHADGGVAAVAHPHTVADDSDGFRAAFRAFADLDMDGVECHYSEYTPSQRLRMVEVARSFGLVPTGGSDYHGAKKAHLAVGVGNGDLRVPDQVLEELRALRS